MRNYCGDCDVILAEPVEWRYGFCSECLAIRFERAEVLDDEWYGIMEE